jgi:hypothetical protein
MSEFTFDLFSDMNSEDDDYTFDTEYDANHDMDDDSDIVVQESDLEEGSVTGEMRDLTELGAVRSLQSVVYRLFVEGYGMEALKEVRDVMLAYTEQEGKDPNYSSLEKVISGVERMYLNNVTKEEALALWEDSNRVENNVWQQIQILVSKVGAKCAIVDLDNGVLIHSDNLTVQGYVEKFAGKSLKIPQSDMGPDIFASQYAQLTRDLLRSKPGLTLGQRIVDTVTPLNLFILEGERKEIVKVYEHEATKLHPGQPGFKTTISFPTKIVTTDPHKNMIVASHTILNSLKPDLVCDDGDVIVQAILDRSLSEPDLRFDNVYSFSFPKNLLDYTEDEELHYADSLYVKLGRRRDILLDRGIMRIGKGKTLVLSRWDKKLTDVELAMGNMIGYTDKATIDKLNAAIKKVKRFANMDPVSVKGNLTWTLIDPLSRKILVVPKKFLRRGSSLETDGGMLGMKIRTGLLGALNGYCSAFFLGILSSPDWHALDDQFFYDVVSRFPKLQSTWSDKWYRIFITKMIAASNIFKPLAVYYPGSKSLVDPDVASYLGEAEWEDSDDSYEIERADVGQNDDDPDEEFEL